MKQLAIVFSLIFLCVFAKAQFPTTQYMGNSKTIVKSKGAFGSDSGYVYAYSFPDTATANRGFLKNIGGITIAVGNDIYMRAYQLNQWIKISVGGNIVNIYNSNGTFNSNRFIDADGHSFNIYHPSYFTVQHVTSGNLVYNENGLTLQNSGVNFNGELQINNNSGDSGQVLMSNGNGNNPSWEYVGIDSIRSVKSLLFNSPSTFTLNGTTGVITETLASQAANSVFRTTTAGTPSFGTLDSTHVPALHSEGYYNTKYAAVGSGVDSTAYHTVSSVGTNGFSINTLKGVKDTIIFNIPDTSNKFVSQIYRTAGKDSIFYRIGTQVYAIKDSTGGGSSSGTRATRIALSPLAGQQFWQTDEAIGMYVYNGSSWEYQINPNNIIDQCHFANNTLTGTSFISFGAGTGNGVTFPNPENGYTSIISLNTGTTATGAIQVYNNNGSYWVFANSGVKYYSEFICKIPTLSNSTDRFICRINQANNWTSPTSGYWFEYSDTLNSGRWIIRTSDNSTVTTFNSSVTVDNNWHKYSIAYTSSTSISFYIDDVLITTATTTTAPSASPLQISITKRIGTTSRSLYCDKIIMSTY